MARKPVEDKVNPLSMPGSAPMPGGAPATPTQAPQAISAPMPGVPGSNLATVYDVDLTDVDSAFVIPDGDYVVSCVDIEQSISQAQNPMIIWTFAIKDGEHKGKEFKSFTALTAAAMWKVAETVAALGIGSVGTKVKFTRPDVVGRECIAKIEVGEYKSQKRSQIANVRPIGA